MLISIRTLVLMVGAVIENMSTITFSNNYINVDLF